MKKTLSQTKKKIDTLQKYYNAQLAFVEILKESPSGVSRADLKARFNIGCIPFKVMLSALAIKVKKTATGKRGRQVDYYVSKRTVFGNSHIFPSAVIAKQMRDTMIADIKKYKDNITGDRIFNQTVNKVRKMKEVGMAEQQKADNTIDNSTLTAFHEWDKYNELRNNLITFKKGADERMHNVEADLYDHNIRIIDNKSNLENMIVDLHDRIYELEDKNDYAGLLSRSWSAIKLHWRQRMSFRYIIYTIIGYTVFVASILTLASGGFSWI